MRNLIMMQKSNAFSVQSEPMKSNGFSNYNKVEDFASIEVENDRMRRQITEIEQQFSQSHQEFFNMSQQKFFTESEYDKYKREA